MAMDPQIPFWPNVAFTTSIAAIILLLVVALISLMRAVPRARIGVVMAWLAVILLVPGAGPLLWFALGRPGLYRSTRPGHERR